MTRFAWCVFALAACVVLGSLTHAQTTTATLFGNVVDSQGASIPTARVTALNVATGFQRATLTDDTGAYLITNLPVGQYTLTVEHEGFRRFVQQGITITVNENARVDAALSVGQVNESVTVTAEATGVDTRSSSMGEVVDRARVQELPLKGRNAMELARVVPGVVRVSAPTAVTGARNGPQVTVAGGRDTENEFRLDGTAQKNLTHNSALNLPSPDALQEFKVQTSNFSAEYGRYGGGVFVAVTRAGGNQFHGSAWEYLRNKELNARNFFATDRPDLKQNQFGFTLGGPIVHNRTFFFGSYQGLRIRESQLFSTARPPAAAVRAGDFSGASAIIDPLTNQAFPGNRIPSTRFDPVAVKLVDKYVPLPNVSDGRWVQLVSRPTDGDQYLLRVDHNFSAKNTLNVRYFRDDSALITQSGNISGYSPYSQSLVVTNWALQDTHTFSPSVLNEFRIGVMRADSLVSMLERTQLSDFGANYPGVISPQLPNININGFFNLGSTDSFSEHPNIYSIGNTVRWFRGRHSISVGSEFERTEMINRGASANQGTFTFDGSITRNAWADFLIGLPNSLDQASPYERMVKGWDWYAFVQDDVRVTRRLTLNLGLRYQFFRPYHAVYDRTNTYRAGQRSQVIPGAPLGMVFPGDADISRGLVAADRNNFGPRVGFAWDPTGTGRLAVRSSYGLFHEDFRSDLWTYPAVNQPFVIRELVLRPYSLTDPYRGRVNPFPYVYTPQNAKFSFPMGLFTVLAPTLNSPYVHHISFSIEKSLPANTVFKAAYVSKLAHNLVRMTQQNPAVYRAGATVGNTDQRRVLLPGIYSSFREVATNSNASYHSLQLLANKRLSHGVTVLASYTLGKMLDYYSAMNLGQTPQDPYNHRADRANSDEDRRHILNVSFVYSLPMWRQQKGIVGRALGGWMLSGVVGYASGRPIHVLSGQDYSLTGVGWDRPNLVGNPVRDGFASKDDMLLRFFNTAAFVPNLAGAYGSAARNLIYGPSQSTTDLSIVKSFAISERLGKIQFRAELYNAWNQVNFGIPEARVNNRLFGQIQSAGDPRIVQLALRYQF